MHFSYTSLKMGINRRISELWNLYEWRTKASKNRTELVRVMIAQLQHTEKMIFEHADLKLTGGVNVLEIGPGQKCYAMRYFAAKNSNVTGIDMDKIVSGFDLLGYYRMWRINGVIRVIKTLGNKILGFDRKFHQELLKQLGSQSLPKLKVLAMDASNMNFKDASFDVVYSHSVFEHLVEPGDVIDEVVRVLKPGGCAYLTIHLYTSESGCHDPRIFSGNRSYIPLWSHLRPQHENKVQPNAYLNQLRMNQWDQLFTTRMPGAVMEKLRPSKAKLEQLHTSLKKIRDNGELQEYTDDELLTVSYVAIWQKPR